MRVGVFTLNRGFLEPVLESLERRGHEVMLWKNTRSNVANWLNLQRILDRCDVAFFDWTQNPFSEAMRLEGLSCKIAVRAHGIPFFGMYKTFAWQKVDLLIGAAAILGHKMNEAKNQPKQYLHIPPGSDPTLFTIPADKKYHQNICTHSWAIRFKKRVYTTIQTFYDLLQHDERWKLHIVGDWERKTEGWAGMNYTEPCKELIEDLKIGFRVYRSPNMGPKTWAASLGDMDIFLSNSIREGLHVSLVDAMLTGVYPLINCWRGSDEYYPADNIFKTQGELVDKILEWESHSVEEKRRLSGEMREWAAERFDSSILADTLVEALEALV